MKGFLKPLAEKAAERLREASTLRGILEVLLEEARGLPEVSGVEGAEEFSGYLVVFVNGVMAEAQRSLDMVLSEHDTVTILPLVHGGLLSSRIYY